MADSIYMGELLCSLVVAELPTCDGRCCSVGNWCAVRGYDYTGVHSRGLQKRLTELAVQVGNLLGTGEILKSDERKLQTPKSRNFKLDLLVTPLLGVTS